MTTNSPGLYEVWKLPFAYKEDPTRSKERPIVVGSIHEGRAVVMVLKVTGHGPRPDYPGEVCLIDWQDAGLSKPSTVRYSKQLLVPSDAFLSAHRYGRLSERDAQAVREALLELGSITC